MARQVAAYVGYNGKLFREEKAAEASLLTEPLYHLEIILDRDLKHAMGPCAYSPTEAMTKHRATVKAWLELHEKVYPADG